MKYLTIEEVQKLVLQHINQEINFDVYHFAQKIQEAVLDKNNVPTYYLTIEYVGKDSNGDGSSWYGNFTSLQDIFDVVQSDFLDDGNEVIAKIYTVEGGEEVAIYDTRYNDPKWEFEPEFQHLLTESI